MEAIFYEVIRLVLMLVVFVIVWQVMNYLDGRDVWGERKEK